MHVYGDAHTVGPVHPMPPHWPQCADVAPVVLAGAVVAAADDVDVFVLMLDVACVVVLVLVDPTEVPAAAASRFCMVV